MDIQEICHQLIDGIRNTTWLEGVAVVSGIASVWFSRMENILVYPVGLVNTIIYIYLSLSGHLFGEASVNLYYTVMSIYGWILWARKDQRSRPVVAISFSSLSQWRDQLLFFAAFYVAIYCCLSFMKAHFAPGAIPCADALASATAYTGMWLMARKKVESWYWWIATNITSIPLYFIKHYEFTSVYYLVLLFLAVAGLYSWKHKATHATTV